MSYRLLLGHLFSLLLLCASLGAHEHGPDCGPRCSHGDATEVVDENGEAVELQRCDGPHPMQELYALADSLSLEHFFLEQPTSTVPLSGDVEIDALNSQMTNAYYSNQSMVITYSFYSDAVFGGEYDQGTHQNVHEVSDEVKANFRDIMNRLSQILDIEFREVTEMSIDWGQIRIMNTDSTSYASAAYPTSISIHSRASHIYLNPSYDRFGDTNGFRNGPGSHGYETLIHELGHALGMKHPFDGSPTMPSDRENNVWTVMSYSRVNGSGATFMNLDTKFLQHAYSYAISTLNEGDTTITVTNSNTDRHSQGGQLPGTSTTRQVLFNPSGYNTLDLAATSSSNTYIIDINPRGWVRRSDRSNRGIMIADNTIISRILSGPGSHQLYSAEGMNTYFAGYAPGNTVGNDVIHDAVAGDTIDLSAYLADDCVESMDGDDALFTMADGTVRVKGYWALSTAERPTILRPIGDGAVLFASLLYTVDEDAGTVVLTVNRLGSDGAASVDYATIAGSAEAGSHYEHIMGTLHWANGDETPKTIEVTIIDNLVADPEDPSFVVELSSPSGVDLAFPATTTVTIIDNDVAPAIALVWPKVRSVAIPESVGLVLDVDVTWGPQVADPSTGTVSWSVEDASGSVTWDNQNQMQTAARFSAGGSYVLRLIANDGHNTTTQDIEVEVGVEHGSGSVYTAEDIGTVAINGTTSYDSATNTFTLGVHNTSGSGADIWNSPDNFRFVYEELEGDGEIIAQIQSLTGGVQHTKVGVMMRASDAADAMYAASIITDNQGQVRHMRRTATGSGTTSTADTTTDKWIRLLRSGNTFTTSRSADGNTWTQVGSHTNNDMPSTLLVGLALAPQNSSNEIEAVIANVEGVGGPTNVGPVVDAGADVTNISPLSLSGSASDPDDVPEPLVTLWVQQAGTGSVTFTDASAPATTASFSAEGAYTLRLTAHDGEVKTFGDMTATVTSGDLTYTVIYEANGGTGATPEDSNAYAAGATVTVLGQGDFLRNQHIFSGWNTQDNGDGLGYAEGDTFSMPAANVTLYAQWTAERILMMYLLPDFHWQMFPEPAGEPTWELEADPPRMTFPPVDSSQDHTLIPMPATGG